MKTIFLVLLGVLVSFGVLAFEPALAEQTASQLSNSGVFNHVLHGFYQATGTWGPIMQRAASRLFWALATISMVWTFGMMALRKADIGEFFAEFARFTITTGFYWWLLANAVTGMNIGGTILSSLQQLGAEAGGLGTSNLGPSSIVDLGFQLYDRTLLTTSELGVSQLGTTIVMLLSAIAILLVLALVAINLLLVLASSWILLFGGVFFLGFGGARWTSDIAINYYKTVLGVAAQLLVFCL
ncbi:P-type conjugative transfer protein TrbL [compost metagenome]